MRFLTAVYRSVFLLLILFESSMQFCWAMEEGRPAPSFETRLLSGTSFNLNAEVGHVVILSFWATWCASCRQEMPDLEKYYQRHKAEGLRVVAVSMDDPKDDAVVKAAMAQYGFSAAFSRDAQYKGYGRIWRMPMTFVIDRHGVLRKDGSVGDPRIDVRTLEKIVTPLLN